MSNVTFNWSNLPAGYCWTGPQQYMDDILALLTGTLPGSVGVYVSTDLPPVENNSDLWVRLNYDGTMEGIYKFLGVWHRPHPVPPSSPTVIIYKGTEASLKTYDGGVDEAVTSMTGPFWERDTDFDFRFPLGIGDGTIYDAVPAITVVPGDTGGDEKVLLDTTTIPEHSHNLYTNEAVSSTGTPSSTEPVARRADTTPGGGEYEYEMQKGAIDPDVGESSLVGDGKYHQNMPPFLGVLFIRRTARVNYTALV